MLIPRSRRLRLVLGALVLGGLVLSLPPVRTTLWTSLLLSDFLAGESPSLFKFLSRAPHTSQDSLATPDGPVPFALYRPPGQDPAAGLILVHGFAHRGKQDPRIDRQARRLARAGFVVMAPDLEAMKSYKLSFADARALTACMAHLRAVPQVDSARIGLIAPSFAAGPALIALSRAPAPLRFALVFGGYYDLRRTLHYTLTGAYTADGQAGRIDPGPNRRNRWKFLAGNLDLLPASPSRAELALFLQQQIAQPERPVLPHLDRFAAAEQNMVRFMANEEPALFDSLYATVPAPVRAWVDTLSLHHYSAAIQTPLLLVHSTGDGKVPYTESLALSRALPQSPASRLYIVDLFAHVDLAMRWDSLATVWNHTLPGLGRLWLLVYDLVRHAA